VIESQALARTASHAPSYRPPQMLHLRATPPRRGPMLWARLRAAYTAFARPKECGC
jgi:hypothetical protein